MKDKNKQLKYKVLPSVYDEEYYKSNCSGYRNYRKGIIYLPPHCEYIFRKIPQALKNTSKFLDAGCGRGEFMYFMSKKGYEVYGIDYSEDSLKLTESLMNKYNIHATLKKEDVRYTTFPENYFDYIVSTDVIEHLDDNIASLDFINEMYRLLKPGGTFILHTSPNKLRTDYFEKYYQVYIDFIIKTVLNLFKESNDKYQIPRDSKGRLDPRSPSAYIMHVNEQTPYSLEENFNKSRFIKYKVSIEAPILYAGFTEIIKLPYYVVAHLYPLNKLPVLKTYLGSELFVLAVKTDET